MRWDLLGHFSDDKKKPYFNYSKIVTCEKLRNQKINRNVSSCQISFEWTHRVSSTYFEYLLFKRTAGKTEQTFDSLLTVVLLDA